MFTLIGTIYIPSSHLVHVNSLIYYVYFCIILLFPPFPVKINTNDLVKAIRNYCFKCLNKLNLFKLFGIRREIKSMETSSIFNLGILRVYIKNHKIITKCVHSEKDDTLWICNDGESLVRKTKHNDNKIKTIGELRCVYVCLV